MWKFWIDAGQHERRVPADVGLVRRRRVVHEDLDRASGSRPARSRCWPGRAQPAQSTIGGAAGAAAHAEPTSGPRSTAALPPAPSHPPAAPAASSVPHPSRHDADLDHEAHNRRTRRCVARTGSHRWTVAVVTRAVICSCYRWVDREEEVAMGHFRSNLRDLEFNLFEVFRVQDRLGTAPVRRRRPRDRARHAHGAQHRRRRPARRVFRRRRPQPARVRPRHPLRHAAAVAQGRLQAALGRRVVAPRPARRAGRLRHPADACSGRRPS